MGKFLFNDVSSLQLSDESLECVYKFELRQKNNIVYSNKIQFISQENAKKSFSYKDEWYNLNFKTLNILEPFFVFHKSVSCLIF